jgi:hypothetical protein
MRRPTTAQLESQYNQCHWLTNVALHPIHLIRLDERTGNIFILAGKEESIELQIKPDGGLL